ncbi:MAG: glycine cleavage system aminomethyltransferase GcvT [Acidimicrobiales bacterium]|jgi:aminomethyltransferase
MTTSLRQSPLRTEHEALGAKFVEFGGWEMPLSYPAGTLREHLTCRRAAVVFDVSHLGTVRLDGVSPYDLLQESFTNDLAKIGPGRAQYTHLLAEDGSVADDCIIWWLDETTFDVMPNASNTASVREAIGGEDTTASRAIIAVQGPTAREVIAKVAPAAAGVAHFGVARFGYHGVDCVAAGTGYTGEDGVECAVPAVAAPEFFRAVVDAGALPAGLGARDTLRLEAGLPLFGYELGPGITPVQAGLGWVVAWYKPVFRGKAALEAEREAGITRRLRGLVSATRRFPRSGDRCRIGGADVGFVTSGSFSPVLERGIALAFLPPGVADGNEVEADVRGTTVLTSVAKPPFQRLALLAPD